MKIGAGRLELPASWSRTKRATELRYAPTYLVVNVTLSVPNAAR